MQRPDPLRDLVGSTAIGTEQAGSEPARAHQGDGAPSPWRAGTHASDRGCLRYRGGRPGKGQPPAALNDDQDLAAALDELAAGREALAAAHQVPRQHRRDRREAFAGALAKLALASRFLDEVLLRRGGTPGDLAP